MKTLEEAQGMVLAVSWSSQFLAAAGMDKKVRVYDSAKDARAGLKVGRGQGSDAAC